MDNSNPPDDYTPDEREFLELVEVDGLSDAEREQLFRYAVDTLRNHAISTRPPLAV